MRQYSDFPLPWRTDHGPRDEFERAALQRLRQSKGQETSYEFTEMDGQRVVRDASVGGNLARFINHSCHPNCYSRVVGRTIWICAARAIAPGEELTYDYNTDGAAHIACRCEPGCRTVL
jgi:SET domain-containing protein